MSEIDSQLALIEQYAGVSAELSSVGKIIDIGMEYNACEARLKDMCYKEDRNSRTTNKEELGLLIWKEGRYWKLRYNK